jgi:hypothetical protein
LQEIYLYFCYYKFKTTSVGPNSSRSIILPPTEQELQEIFEELGNISDSGPELEPDKMRFFNESK